MGGGGGVRALLTLSDGECIEWGGGSGAKRKVDRISELMQNQKRLFWERFSIAIFKIQSFMILFSLKTKKKTVASYKMLFTQNAKQNSLI